MPKTKTRLSKRKVHLAHKGWFALVIVLIVAVVGLVILRFSEASTSAAPKGPIYWLGDSLSTGMVTEGALATKLERNGYSPAFINQNPGRSITATGFGNQDAFQAVMADNKNVCPGATIQSIVNYCRQHNNRYNPVADANTVVVFLGTNPELSSESFSSLQKQLLDKIRSINPRAKIYWGDIASPGNYQLALESSLNWERYFTGKPFTPGTAEYNKFISDFNLNNDNTRKRLQNNLYKIHQNAISLKYQVISQFKFLWGENVPLNEFTNKANQKDPKGYLNVDGVHYEPPGSQKLADYFVSKLNSGGFTTAQALPTFIDLNNPLEFNLTAPPKELTVKNCAQQIGFKQNSDFRGCNVSPSQIINITPNSNSATKSMLFPNKKLSVCIGSLSNSRDPLRVRFMLRGVMVGVASLNYGSENELSKLRACGITDKTISELDTIEIIPSSQATLTTMELKVAP